MSEENQVVLEEIAKEGLKVKVDHHEKYIGAVTSVCLRLPPYDIVSMGKFKYLRIRPHDMEQQAIMFHPQS
jgi:hypothetical protein